MQDVALAGANRVEAVEVDDLGEDRQPPRGSPARGRARRSPPAGRPSSTRAAPSARSQRRSKISWPWMRSGSYSARPRSSAAIVVTVPATPTARSASPCGSSPRTCSRIALTSSPKRSVMRTQPTSRLSRTALPTSWISVEPPPMSTTSVPGLDSADPAQGQLGLLLAAQEAGGEAVAPLDLAEKRLAVLRVADGARADAQRPLCAERLQLAAEVGEDVPDAGDRDGQEAAPLVDALAQPRDHEPADDLLERSVRVGDQETGRVRPQVDCSDPHLRGTRPVTRSSDARASASAEVSTFSRARDSPSRASDASSRVPLSVASARCRSMSALACRSVRVRRRPYG